MSDKWLDLNDREENHLFQSLVFIKSAKRPKHRPIYSGHNPNKN